LASNIWKYHLYRSIWSGLDVIFPPTCAGCGKSVSRWCKECQAKVKILDGKICYICGLPQNNVGVCTTCRADRPHFRELRGWAVFEDPLRSALHKLKYRRDISLGESLAVQMMSFVQTLPWDIEMIIPIPLGKERLRKRGYNQVGMIARPLALALDVQYESDGLIRKKETRSQVGLTRRERKDNVNKAFIVHAMVNGRTVLVVDDVSTTGATLSSSAEALYASGARDVYALTVARAVKLEHA